MNVYVDNELNLELLDWFYYMEAYKKYCTYFILNNFFGSSTRFYQLIVKIGRGEVINYVRSYW